MEKKYLIGLIIVIMSLFALFFLTSWTNPYIIQNAEKPGISVLSGTFAFIMGILIIALVLFLILITLD